jgi:predicted DCC family thiol-disulfide oxidoreductase YuxK
MLMLDTRPPYSFNDDPLVPEFSVPDCFTVMDASCGLCAKGARWIARNDRKSRFRIIPMQSELGSALMHHYGMDPKDPLSWLYVSHGLAYTSLDAVIRVAKELGGVWRMLGILRILPVSLQDTLYGYIARNRYRFMGRTELCNMPDPDIQRRLLT